jgi:hypothetical protein
VNSLQDPHVISRLLESLRGGGFRVRITLPGAELIGQKIITVADGLVYSVDGAGNTWATRIAEIRSVEF